MIASTATALYGELVARGIELDVRDGQLRYRPRSSVDADLRAAMAACKPELIELVVSADAVKRAGQSPLPVVAGSCEQTLSVALSVLSANGQPTGPCYCCRGSKWWRLRGKREWFCFACAAPGLSGERIETLDVTARPGAGLYQSRARSRLGGAPVHGRTECKGTIDVEVAR